MAADTVSIPAPDPIGPRVNDAQLADAFRDMESAIADLRRMSALMEMAAEVTVFRVEGDIERHIHDRVGLKSHRIHVLTEDQSDGLDYAIRHTYDLIRALHAKYYAGYGERAAS